MKLPARPRSRLMFNITPLIDIVFNIMIFFLVTAHFVQSQEMDEVDLPPATEVADEATVPKRVIVTVLADSTLRVSGRSVDISGIESIIASAAQDPEQLEVQIRADAVVPYAAVEPILFTCARYGVQQVGFKVVENTAP